ncbi:MAG: glycosyltransferase [Ruminococcaceae bacterium]|nr:glycosyltransferase [Oscillospiraceae bacterium]
MTILLTVLRFFGLYFAAMGLFALRRPAPIPRASPRTRFAVVIPARNEAAVIGRTVTALLQMDYPRALYDVFVLPNNCRDDTAERSRRAGARVLRCCGTVTCKGDVLRQAAAMLSGCGYDTMVVFDADNLVRKDYLSRINDAFCQGARICKGKCLCSNPFDTWVTGCYAIYFALFNLFYSRARSNIGLSAKLNGTGFAVSFDLLEELGGWPTVTMAEDAEFAAVCAAAGERVVWVPEAVSYDEQPLTLRESVIQRTRWCGGIMQAARCRLPAVLRAALRGRLTALDFIPFLLTPFVQALSPLTLFCGSPLRLLLTGYAGAVLLALLVLLAEGPRDRRMLRAVLCYGFFMATWAPICLYCLLRPEVRWREMTHGRGSADASPL